MIVDPKSSTLGYRGGKSDFTVGISRALESLPKVVVQANEALP